MRKYTLKCGGTFAKLCDGTEKSLSWDNMSLSRDNILWNSRTILTP